MDTIPFPSSAELDREARVQALMADLRSVVEAQVRAMAESRVDTPPDRIFGDIEFTLRDQANRLAAQAHQIALDGDKKGQPRLPPRLPRLSGRCPIRRTPEPRGPDRHQPRPPLSGLLVPHR